jgi:hypothetical protein
MNIAEIEMQLAELVKQQFDRAEFPLRLIEIYNAPKATLTKLRTGTQNKGEQPGDLLRSRKLYFRAAGHRQAAATIDTLKESKATKSQKPRFLLVTDGLEVAAYDAKAAAAQQASASASTLSNYGIAALAREARCATERTSEVLAVQC